ncbi:hypothetical protein AAHC03_01517 [Spirometra sp. Aus1]
MPKDLLSALQQEAGIDATYPQNTSVDNNYLTSFFNEVETLRNEVNEISNLVTEIKSRHSEILAAPNQDEKTKARVEEIMAEIKRRGGFVRTSLKQLEASIQQEEAANGDAADIRIKKTQHSTIARRFLTVMQDYSKAQTDYRDANKTRIPDRRITDEELEDMLESGDPQIFTQSIMADTQQARQTLNEIEARHQDILRLEQSIRELRDMFQDLATLVDSQGETIDRIESNVLQTVDYVETAKTDFHHAVTYQKKSRKKKIIIGCVVAAILLIIIISLIASLTPR